MSVYRSYVYAQRSGTGTTDPFGYTNCNSIIIIIIICKDMADSSSFFISLPEDINFKIASLLQVPILPISYHACYTFQFHFHSPFYFFHVFQVRDLCALGCCSKFWRQLCFSDSIWHSLVTNRWPLLHSSLSPYIKVGYQWFFFLFFRFTQFLILPNFVNLFQFGFWVVIKTLKKNPFLRLIFMFGYIA